MTWFEPQTSGIGSDRATNWATQPLPKKSSFAQPKMGCLGRTVILKYNLWDEKALNLNEFYLSYEGYKD